MVLTLMFTSFPNDKKKKAGRSKEPRVLKLTTVFKKNLKIKIAGVARTRLLGLRNSSLHQFDTLRWFDAK